MLLPGPTNTDGWNAVVILAMDRTTPDNLIVLPVQREVIFSILEANAEFLFEFKWPSRERNTQLVENESWLNVFVLREKSGSIEDASPSVGIVLKKLEREK